MSASRLPTLALGVLAALALAGCSGGRAAVGEALGFDYDSPDAFAVSPRAPLRLPTNLTELPPPSPGAPSPLEPEPQRQARAALAGAGAAATPEASPAPGELALIAAAGPVDPEIRAAVAADAAVPRPRQFGLRTFFGMPVPDGSEADRLVARDEAVRLEEQGLATPTPAPLPERTPGRIF